ncbi:DUF2806 domain-containing protein [Sorangium sp. So ce295]|uniref:DUF2806 domain-containing protein n=1 Tax=Sorangium sp. So ce295 TaxID=3133295 RepID=UPI003F62533E
MTNENEPQSANEDESAGGALATVGDVVADLVTGASIPAPIRRNLFQAFGQLCSAAIDVPIAYLEGAAAEKRAEAQARVKIISTGANQIAAQMKVDPEFARVAVKKYGQRIIREQVNLDQVAAVAARELKQLDAGDQKTAGSDEVPPIDDDWLNAFEKEACQKSTKEMRELFGRILAGEIRKPSSFSIRTVKLMGELDRRAASIFQRLASLTISLRMQGQVIDARVVSLSGNAAQNSLQDYGLSFGNLNVLHEFGLIIHDYNSYMDYRASVAIAGGVGFPFTFQDRQWVLIPEEERSREEQLRVNGVALSASGKQLLGILDPAPDVKYSAALQEFFRRRKLIMTEV